MLQAQLFSRPTLDVSYLFVLVPDALIVQQPQLQPASIKSLIFSWKKRLFEDLKRLAVLIKLFEAITLSELKQLTQITFFWLYHASVT